MERIERALNEISKPVKGSKVLILGASYKAGSGDTRESPALKILRLLEALEADLSFHDPYVPRLEQHGLESVDLDPALGEADLVAIVTAHPELDYADVVAKAALVLDFRGVTRGIEATNLIRL